MALEVLIDAVATHATNLSRLLPAFPAASRSSCAANAEIDLVDLRNKPRVFDGCYIYSGTSSVQCDCECHQLDSVMLSRKSYVIASACSNLAGVPLVSPPPSSTTSSQRRLRQDGTRHNRQPVKGYATIASDSPRDGIPPPHVPKKKAGTHTWPQPLAGQPCPTPYQIFDMTPKSPYSKTRFYAMVKIYHPDLNNSASTPAGSDIAHHVRLERYRLIVAAHTILSDPTKRSAYDRLGTGWNGKGDRGDSTMYSSSSSGRHAPGPFSHGYNNSSDPIWQNATWEDWERFYARRAREQGGESAAASSVPQGPRYMQNSHFIALVVLLAMMGSSANYNRAQDAGAYFIEQRDLVHDRAAKDLRRVRQETGGMKARDERIEYFLRQREATMGSMALTDREQWREERAARLLPDKEVCRSEGVSERDTPRPPPPTP